MIVLVRDNLRVRIPKNCMSPEHDAWANFGSIWMWPIFAKSIYHVYQGLLYLMFFDLHVI